MTPRSRTPKTIAKSVNASVRPRCREDQRAAAGPLAEAEPITNHDDLGQDHRLDRDVAHSDIVEFVLIHQQPPVDREHSEEKEQIERDHQEGPQLVERDLLQIR